MEYWDLYDENKNMLERKVRRGDKLNDGEYHLVVNVWLQNKKGEFLISQRAAGRTYEFKWECTGGSAVMGETSIQAAIRELREELGVNLSEENARFIGSALRHYPNCDDILDVWLFKCDDIPVQELVLQEEEVCDAKWATPEEIRALKANGNFEANPFFDEALNG